MRGFESYNKFKTNVKDSRQIYDITYHLYQTETDRLAEELSSGGTQPHLSFRTNVGSVEHSPTALYQRLQTSYPFKLRQLILISTITALEVYLTDVILEVFERDIKPFKVNEPVTLQKNYLLSSSSINKIQADLITKDFRSLTSGGLKEIEKYYNKIFGIDIKNFGVSYQDIEEIHVRRHLFVHRNGITDNEYVSKFPSLGYSAGHQIRIDHAYLVGALDKLSAFAGLINKALLAKFPEIGRRPLYHRGSVEFKKNLVNLMIEIGVSKEGFDAVDFLTKLIVRNDNLSNYIVQVTSVDSSCFLFVSGKQSDLAKFFKPIEKHASLSLNRIIELQK